MSPRKTQPPPLALVSSEGLCLGGEGGGLPSGKEGGKETSLSPSNQNGEPATLADALRASGVMTLSRPKRMELARDLAAEGVTAADVFALRDYLLVGYEREVGKAQRVLAAKLMDPTDRVAMFEDLRMHLDARRAIEASKDGPAPSRIGTATHDFGFPSPIASCACPGCNERRAAGWKNWEPIK